LAGPLGTTSDQLQLSDHRRTAAINLATSLLFLVLVGSPVAGFG